MAVLIVGTVLGGPVTVQAGPTFVVNSPVDVAAGEPLEDGRCETAPGNGVCTLRAAIMKANHFPGGGAIIMLPPGTLTLTIPATGSATVLEGDEATGDLNITGSMSIVGAGPGATVIDGNGGLTHDRVMTLHFTAEVSITGVTIRGGVGRVIGGSFVIGGGILNFGTLTLANSVVSGNSLNALVPGGCGGCGGGGIASFSTLIMTNSIVSGNSVTIPTASTCAFCGGGGIYNSGLPATLTNSTVSDNGVTIAGVCSSCGGGGIYIDFNGVVTATNSTVSGNSVVVNTPSTCSNCGGGGVTNGKSLTMTNSTVSGNRATTDGGGILNYSEAVTNVFNSTITGNKANTSNVGGIGGGVTNRSGGSFILQGTILAGNDLVFIFDDCAGTLFATSKNLLRLFDDTRCTVGGTPPILAPPQLGPLQNNGGLTQTHAPLPGSPAIDAENPPGCRDGLGAFLTTDQRGLPRGANSDPCDLGAVEVQPATGLVAAILPGSRSVQVNATATAFGTIINTGPTPATGCRIAPTTSLPATFHYQTTNSANQVTGMADTPVDIPGGAAQGFVLGFTPVQAFLPTDVQFAFDCTDSNPAPTTTGLNTLLLSASATPVPDIVALAATITNDGIVNILGPAGAGAFAVATVNVGASGSITASADTGAATLPVSLAICESHPGTGACLAPPSGVVATTINAATTPTFGVFVTGAGTVPFDPATNRVFVRFKDASGITRGSTSVAVRTQ